jgi:hypothetical protein
MLSRMPTANSRRSEDDAPSRPKRCKALTTSGSRCGRSVVPGLTVCKSHGGGTAASVRKSRKVAVERQAGVLWGIAPNTGGISVAEQLEQLARNKMTDIIALRIKISEDEVAQHIGVLETGRTSIEYNIQGTVQSKEGTQRSRMRAAGVSVWVQELHKTEMEYVAILKLLHEVTGGQEEFDLKRVKMQAARQAARILKGFPGISVDDVAAEVAKSA